MACRGSTARWSPRGRDVWTTTASNHRPHGDLSTKTFITCVPRDSLGRIPRFGPKAVKAPTERSRWVTKTPETCPMQHRARWLRCGDTQSSRYWERSSPQLMCPLHCSADWPNAEAPKVPIGLHNGDAFGLRGHGGQIRRRQLERETSRWRNIWPAKSLEESCVQ